MDEKIKNESLLKKLGKKFAPLALAGALTVSSLTGCNPNEFFPQESKSEKNPEAESTSESVSSTEKNVLEKFKNNSQLLKDLLTDEYYNYLINLVKTNKLSSMSYVGPHPFAFLEDQGHDVNRVRSGALSCTTHTFTKDEEPNKLYMAVYVENDGEYYTEYLLRYTLTEKEMSDYEMLFEKGTLQARFINNEVSKKKTPEILLETYMSKTSHDGLQNDDNFNGWVEKNIDSNNHSHGFLLKDFDIENHTFTILLFSKQESENTRLNDDCKITELIIGDRMGDSLYLNNNILTSPFRFNYNCYELNNPEISNITSYDIATTTWEKNDIVEIMAKTNNK